MLRLALMIPRVLIECSSLFTMREGKPSCRSRLTTMQGLWLQSLEDKGKY